MTGTPKGYGRQLLEFALLLAASAWLLNFAWALIRPLLPIAAFLMVAVVVIPMVIRRYRNW